MAAAVSEAAEAKEKVEAAGEKGGGGRGGGGDDSEEDEEDVFEVEKILDVKAEGGKILYKVRWKGYSSDDDTWEPEAHLEDCKEVLLEFQKKIVDAKPKPVKKEVQKLPLNDDLFEADSEADSDWQSDTKDDLSPNKKKKKSKEREDKYQDEMRKKKSKLAKGKERPVLERENSSESLTSDSKPKKRTSEVKEDTKDSKKQRREDSKDSSKKKGEFKDIKKKIKEEFKENKHFQKDRSSALQLDFEPGMLDSSFSPGIDDESVDLDSDSSEEKHKIFSGKDQAEEESLPRVLVVEKHPDSSTSTDNSCEVKVKKKKKKHKRPEEPEDSRKVDSRDRHLEKKSSHKKQKLPEKARLAVELEHKRSAVPAPVQKGSRPSNDERGHKSTDSAGELSNHTKQKYKEAKSGQSHARDVGLPKSAASDGKEKIISWRADEEKTKERHSHGELSMFEKFVLDSDCGKGGSAASKKGLPKNNAEDISKDRSTSSKEKEAKKIEVKDKPQKRHDSEKEEKSRKEQKVFRNLKEMKSAFDVFNLSLEEKNDLDNRKSDDSAQDCRPTEELKLRNRYKDNKSTRDETDTWAYIAAEGDRDAIEDCPETKQQTVSLGMDMQLEWLTLEDFQKHLYGKDENHLPKEAVTSTQLREAVKNGHYATVKMALNSNEDYNLDQEDSSGMTLVMLAAAGGHDDILRLLVRKGAKVNCRQKNGTTALIHAAEKNNLTTVAILLEAGACVNLQQNSGETALMKACKRGNYDIVRLMIESGADCNISSKHQSNALHFAKQCNNLLVYELLRSHLATLSRVAEETIREYFEARLSLMEPMFDVACHRLCEGPDYSLDFTYKPPQNVPEGSGILLFIFHANFFGKDIVARLCGPCSVQAVVLNDKFQLPVFLDSHFIYSFSPIPGPNKLFIRLVEAPTAKVKLLIGAYRVKLQ
ncbi:M-phase phosphoprotein 8 isoform X2 [Sphaerodactylus townsendi]|uniref:M-phase phosphoprotein 8 isoform X2 n=1 Tax=Sphaerodactylus townsendi TaxID=933632 RepID=UPI0020269677|nr:M-phase phosphoprotein 8 isoform X2 [Sphaerodactylus townsendi]